MKLRFLISWALACVVLSGCASTSLQGYADRSAPTHSISSIAALVSAPAPFVMALQSSLTEQGKQQGVSVVDALSILPPTRSYTDIEVKKALAGESIDAVLLINVGNSSIQREYAGTIFNGQVQSTSTVIGNSVQTSGTLYGASQPMVRTTRETDFAARLIEVQSGRVLWVGSGQVSARGRLSIGDGVSAKSSVEAIFRDLKAKGII